MPPFFFNVPGQPSNADEFDVMVDQPLDGRFYYVQIQSEKQEMVRISAELVADLASSLSPVGAVFVSVRHRLSSVCSSSRYRRYRCRWAS